MSLVRTGKVSLKKLTLMLKSLVIKPKLQVSFKMCIRDRNAGIRSVFGIFQQENISSVFDHIRSGREWGLSTLLSHYYLCLLYTSALRYVYERQGCRDSGGHYSRFDGRSGCAADNR